MGPTTIRDRLAASGTQTIASSQPTGSLIPLQMDGVVFRQMFEYPVPDFVSEVGFYAEVMGFDVIAMTSDYALFTTPERDFFLSFVQVDDAHPAIDLRGLKLLFMTGDLRSSERHLRATGLVPDIRVGQGSPVQQVLYFRTPGGVQVEIWEDPGEGDEPG